MTDSAAQALLERAGSLWFSAVLMGLAAFALIAGSLVELEFGRERAMEAFYGAGWFRLLLALVTLNLLARLFSGTPLAAGRRLQTLTHAGLVLILVGAWTTDRFGLHGSITLAPGETVTAFRGQRSMPLGFALTLERYEVETYPGGAPVRAYRSHLGFRDLAGRPAGGGVASMNHPVSHGGFDIFQAGASDEFGDEKVHLDVVRDPGRPLLFGGYIVVGAGMLLTLFTHRRRPPRVLGGVA